MVRGHWNLAVILGACILAVAASDSNLIRLLVFGLILAVLALAHKIDGRRFLLLAFLFFTGPYLHSNGFLLPRPELTPGAIRSIEPQVYCHQRTATVRHTSAALKDSVYRAYGWSLKRHPRGEVDHLVPLELGGKDSRENLWFQPAPEFWAKDSVENWARGEVCSGRLNGVWVQELFKKDWTHLYLHFKRKAL